MVSSSETKFDPADDLLEYQIIQLTRDLVLIESTDSKPHERQRCFQFLRNHLDEINDVHMHMYESGGYESLVALPHGVETPEVLFCAHLDVVEHLGPEYYRSKHKDGRIYGPGAGDMKGALSILLILFQNLLGRYPKIPIGLAVTSDEERGGENGARYLVQDAGLRAGSVIIPDGGSIDEITVEEKGILHAKARLTGTSAHAARPWLGSNPINCLLKGLRNLEDVFSQFPHSEHCSLIGIRDDHWFPTCNISAIETHNESINRIPESVEATFDIRFTNPHTPASMLEIIRKAFNNKAEVEAIITANPTHLQPDPAFLNATEEIIGDKPHLARVAGGSDARFFRQHGIPVMLSRPIVGNLHGHDEWIDIESMVQYYRICERYIEHSLVQK